MNGFIYTLPENGRTIQSLAIHYGGLLNWVVSVVVGPLLVYKQPACGCGYVHQTTLNTALDAEQAGAICACSVGCHVLLSCNGATM